MKSLFTIIFSLTLLQFSYAQGNPMFKKSATEFAKTLNKKSLDKFIMFYNDSVVFRDPSWKSVDTYSQKKIKEMYEGFFSPSSGFNVKILTTALDKKSNTLMILAVITNPVGEESKYAGWFQFKNGKIIEQIDFTSYKPKDLLSSPPFKAYFKKNNLELKQKSN